MNNFRVKGCAAFLIVLLSTSVGIWSAPPEATLSGTVTDANGAVIAKAVIVVHWDAAGSRVGLEDNIGIKEDLRTTTDADGKFSITIPPGFYDLFASSMAFSPSCRKVRVKASRPEEVTIRLQVDPLVSKELAH